MKLRLWKFKSTSAFDGRAIKWRRVVTFMGPDREDWNDENPYNLRRLFAVCIDDERFVPSTNTWAGGGEYRVFSVNARWRYGEDHGWYDGPHCSYFWGPFVWSSSTNSDCKKCTDDSCNYIDAHAEDNKKWDAYYEKMYGKNVG